MKKLFSKLMLVAMAATTFIACEDVPEPYGKPYEKGNNTEIEGAKGTGTKDDPFNCIAALNYGNGLASGEVSGDYYYIKGKVVSVKEEFTTNFGNGTFYISEDGTSTNQFYVYRVLYLGNKKFADGDKQIAVGDDVVICSKITNYNGTIETQQKEGFVYELNGENRGGEPSGGGEPAGDPTGEGTEASPYNVAAALQFTKALGSDVESDKDIYIKGKISQISNEYVAVNFGNATFYISDDGKTSNEFYCYRTLYLGNTKYTAGKTQIKVGDEVIICGRVVNYRGNTIETVQNKAFLFSLNGTSEGGGGETAEAKGTGTKDDPFNAAAANNAASKLAKGAVSDQAYYIKGKVSKIATDKNGNVQNFDYGTYGNASFYISEDGTESGEFYCYRVLYLENAKWEQGAGEVLKAGDEVVVCAKLTNYNGTYETQQNEGYLYSLNGTTKRSGGGGGGGESGDAKGTGTQADPFNAAAANNEAAKLSSGAVSDKAFYIKGKVAKIATDKNGNAQNFDFGSYGNATFYISDDGADNNTFYCYRVLYLENEKWDKDAGDVLKVGDDVIVCAKLTNYNGTYETAQNEGYLYSLNGTTKRGGGGGGGGGEQGTIQEVTVAQFLAAPVSDDVWYQLKGEVQNLKDNDQYGNFDIVDATGSVYVYGLLSEKGGEKKKFQELAAAKGIKNGCTITIIGNRGYYAAGDKIEVLNAYFVSVEGGGEGGGGGQGGGGEVSGNSISVTMASFGLANATDLTTYTLSDGTKLTFSQEDGTNAPKYYDAGSAARLYAKNAVTISSSKTISKVVFDCVATYTGNELLKATPGTISKSDAQVTVSGINATSTKVVNDHTEAKAGTQLRIVSVTITYAE